MSTVPRPERTPQPSEAGQLRELLAAIADALDVPLGDDHEAARQLTRDRAIIVKHIASACAEGVLPTDPARWLRDAVAAISPAPQAPEEVPGE